MSSNAEKLPSNKSIFLWLKKNIKILGVVISVLGGGTAAVYAQGENAADVRITQTEVQELAQSFAKHEALPGHREMWTLAQTISARLDRIETKLDRLLTTGSVEPLLPTHLAYTPDF